MSLENTTITRLNELKTKLEALFTASTDADTQACLTELIADIQAALDAKTAAVLHTAKFYVYRAVKQAYDEATVQHTDVTSVELLNVIASVLQALGLDDALLAGVASGVVVEA